MDMSKSEIEDRDDKTRIAVIILPQPSAISVASTTEEPAMAISRGAAFPGEISSFGAGLPCSRQRDG